MKIGDRFYNKNYGWYEVTSPILANNKFKIKFDNTGYESEATYSSIRDGEVADKSSEHYKSKFHHPGERYINNDGLWFTLLEYKGNKCWSVKFDITGTILDAKIGNIKNGHVMDYNYPSFFGVGYIGRRYGTGDCNIRKETAFSYWNGMLLRCYHKSVHKKEPSYTNCSVCEEWHNYLNFKDWFNKQKFEDNFCLDKDILLKGNKIYSPNTCCFVPRNINSLFTKREKDRGNLPIGVQKEKERYKAAFTKYGKCTYIGTFDTPEEAFLAYKQAKEAYIKEIAYKWKDKIASNVYEAMMRYEVEITD